MIRTKIEYTKTVKQVSDFIARLTAKKKALKEMKLTTEQIERIIAPEKVFFAQLQAEIDSYEGLSHEGA